MVISNSKSCRGVHDTSDDWAVAVIQGEAELESSVGHHTLNGSCENWTMGLGLEHLDIVWKNKGFLSMSTPTISSSRRGATNDTDD